MHKNPYADDLGSLDAYQSLQTTPQTIRTLVQGWPAANLEKSYAPGKWSARQILIHLAQTELGLSYRLRMALSQNGYTAQPFNQDEWIGIDSAADAQTALDVYTSIRRLNVAMFGKLPAAEREKEFSHPEYGTLSVAWVAHQLAGHDIHHLQQLKRIGD